MTDETPVPPDAAMNGPEEKHKFSWSDADTQTKVATVGVIMVGAALIEVGLIPGMIVGVAATMAPKYVPQVGAALKPAYRSIGRKARAAAAEAQEQVQDIVAEVHAEGAQPNGTAAGAPKA